MHYESDSSLSACPVSDSLQLLGDKWSLLILRDMIFAGKRSYGEFLASSEQIATNILANRLKRLVAANVISKQKDLTNNTKYIYRLTSKGKAIIPVIIELAIWQASFNSELKYPLNLIQDAPNDLKNRWQQDRESVLIEILANL